MHHIPTPKEGKEYRKPGVAEFYVENSICCILSIPNIRKGVYFNRNHNKYIFRYKTNELLGTVIL